MTDLDGPGWTPHTSPWNVSFRERAAQIRKIEELTAAVARLTEANTVLVAELAEWGARAEQAREIIDRFGYGDPIHRRVLNALNGDDR